jgi:hypothetical protein
MEIIFLSDYFCDDFIGGAALNDDVLIARLQSLGHSVEKIKSHVCKLEFAMLNRDKLWLISNFFNIAPDIKDFIQSNVKYSIIAHDYKFVKHTNPALYPDMIVPEAEKINVDFHNQASTVFCQSILQAKIFQMNLPKAKLVNLSGNMWSDKSLEFIGALAKREKRDCFCVVKSPYPQKGVPESIAALIEKRLDYELVADKDPAAFLNKLAEYKGLCYIAKTPESLCRVVVESKMLNMSIMTNQLVGASHEPWFKEKDVLKIITQKQKEIPWQISERLKAS